MSHARENRPPLLRPVFAVVALIAAAHLRGQCANSWQPIATGTNGEIRAMTPWDPDGAGPQPLVVVVGGNFSIAGGIPANGAATYDPVLGTWSALGLPQYAIVNSLTVLANGTLIAAGTTLGTSYFQGLVSWNGSSWTPIVPNTINVRCLLPLPNGDLIVGGYFQSIGGVAAKGVARWDGASWSALPGLELITIINPGIDVLDLVQLTNGDLVAGGLFNCSGGQYLARWDGTTWTSINPLPSQPILGVGNMLALPNGGLVIGASGVRHWDGTSWSLLGTAASFTGVGALTVAPNGDVIAGGYPTGVARWNGTAWSPFGAGTPTSTQAFAWADNGDLLVGGNFPSAGGVVSPNLARVTTSCPATAVPAGGGCPGSGGPQTLAVASLPWADATFRATGTGLPSLAFVLAVTSVAPVSPPLPLALVLAEGVPGCDLHVAPDIVQTLFTTTGTAQSQLFLPNVPPLVGVTFHHQMVPVEIDAAFDLIAVTSTNALALTVGSF